MALLEIGILLLTLGALAALRASGALWVGALAVLWLLWLPTGPGAPAAIAALIPVAMLAVMVFRPELRRQWLSRPLLAAFRKALPPMSDTEREALEAGTVGWERELFSGRPDWQQLFDRPLSRLTPEEQAFIEGPVDRLCAMVDDWKITHEEFDLPPEVWDFIKQNGFFGMIIPREYGGLEFSAEAHSRVVARIASRSITAAVTVMVPNSLGPAKLLLHYGTDAQKEHYLPRLARGEEIPCFALTGPEAGSDAASLPDRGEVCRGQWQGEEVVGIRLNWEKRYITLGPVATVLGLAFHLYDPEHLLGEQEDLGITLALIPTDTPGIDIGNRHFPLNIAFHNGPNRGRDVFIPMDWLIGGPERAGQGWRMLMECLADGRAISLPALSAGAGMLASRATGAYAAVRKQFKLPIGRFDGVGAALAAIAGNTYLMQGARALTCSMLDQGEKPSVASAIVKYHMTERMRVVINHAMDIQGGSGICLGPRNFIGRVYQALPISITVEGANILTRNLIIFGQGAVRCHPYVHAEMEAAADPDAAHALERFDAAFFGHVSLALSNAARSLFHGLTDGWLARVPNPCGCRRQLQRLTRLSAALAWASEVAMLTLGGSLKRRERLSARLGDVLSYLYLAGAAIRWHAEHGCPEEDRPLMRWVMDDCVARSQHALHEFCRNLPLRPAGWLLRLWLLPWGTHPGPDDRLERQVADLLLAPGPARDRLTEGLYVPDSLDQPLGRLEDALRKARDAAPVLARMRRAMRKGELPNGDPEQLLEAALEAGVIDADERAAVEAAVAARREVIQVDEFPPEALKRRQA